jgi:hypothetical protein
MLAAILDIEDADDWDAKFGQERHRLFTEQAET